MVWSWVPFPTSNSVVRITLLLYSCVPGLLSRQASSAVPRLIFICEPIRPILTHFSWPWQGFQSQQCILYQHADTDHDRPVSDSAVLQSRIRTSWFPLFYHWPSWMLKWKGRGRVDSHGSGHRQVGRFCEEGNNHLGFMNWGEFLDLLKICWLLERGSAPWS